MRRKKAKLLFVDDDKYIRDFTTGLAKRLGHRKRVAKDFNQADRIIMRRAAAITRLKQAFEKKLNSQSSPAQRAVLKRKIAFLEKMRQRPFGMIVSDINIPDGNPDGVMFVRGVKAAHPKQKITVFSDDEENIKRILFEDSLIGGAPVSAVSKRDYDYERELEYMIRNEATYLRKAKKR